MANAVRPLRGTAANRTNVTPKSGEIQITTDTNKVFIGDGATAGGNEIAYLGTELTVTPASPTNKIITEGQMVSLNAATLGGKLPSDYVRTTDGLAQTITGIKTFSTSPVVPTPTGSTEAANKGYVDSAVAVGAGLEAYVTGSYVEGQIIGTFETASQTPVEVCSIRNGLRGGNVTITGEIRTSEIGSNGDVKMYLNGVYASKIFITTGTDTNYEPFSFTLGISPGDLIQFYVSCYDTLMTVAIRDPKIKCGNPTSLDKEDELYGPRGGGSDHVFYENDQVITSDYTITEGRSAYSTGPITIADGVTVTIPDGSRWVIH